MFLIQIESSGQTQGYSIPLLKYEPSVSRTGLVRLKLLRIMTSVRKPERPMSPQGN